MKLDIRNTNFRKQKTAKLELDNNELTLSGIVAKKKYSNEYLSEYGTFVDPSNALDISCFLSEEDAHRRIKELNMDIKDFILLWADFTLPMHIRAVEHIC